MKAKNKKVAVRMFEAADGSLYLGKYDITSDGYWMYRKLVPTIGKSKEWKSCYTWFECRAVKNVLSKESRIIAFP